MKQMKERALGNSSPLARRQAVTDLSRSVTVIPECRTGFRLLAGIGVRNVCLESGSCGFPDDRRTGRTLAIKPRHPCALSTVLVLMARASPLWITRLCNIGASGIPMNEWDSTTRHFTQRGPSWRLITIFGRDVLSCSKHPHFLKNTRGYNNSFGTGYS